MSSDYIHYHKRKLRLRFPNDLSDPWFSEDQSQSDGFNRPKFHVSRSVSGPAKEVSPGDRIWLVSQIFSPWGKLPAAIDARFDVAECEESPKGRSGFRYTAANTSRWFLYADASGVLSNLLTISKTQGINPLIRDPEQPIGRYLRSMRKLESGNALEKWEKELDSKEFHFISYRIQDGSKKAFERAKQLADDGIPFFWDRWSLPRRLAERRELISDAALDSHIKTFLDDSSVVWGIESPKYAEENSYSYKEQQAAMQQSKYRAD